MKQKRDFKEIETLSCAKIFRNALNQRNMLQGDLADKLGIRQSSVSTNINRPKIGLDVFRTMLDAMDYDVAVVDRETGEVMWKVAAK